MKAEQNKARPRIAIVGSVNMDLVFRTPRMPLPGETLIGHQFLQVPGGKGANQAVASSRMGGEVSLIARVGADALGQQLLRELVADGIDTRHVAALPGVATGVAGILVADDGENSIVLASGANGHLTPGEVEAAGAAITEAQFLVCQLETPLASVERAMALARAAGVPVIFNPAPIQPLPDSLLASVDYLVLNEVEAGQLSGQPVQDVASAEVAARLLLERGVPQVLLTLGAQGVLLATSDPARGAQVQMVPAFVVPVVDTTAAGDTFVGSLAVALGQGKNLAQACRLAQAAAALSVGKLGAQSSIPQRIDVDAFLALRTE
jgi:ribokinase